MSASAEEGLSPGGPELSVVGKEAHGPCDTRVIEGLDLRVRRRHPFGCVLVPERLVARPLLLEVLLRFLTGYHDDIQLAAQEGRPRTLVAWTTVVNGPEAITVR